MVFNFAMNSARSDGEYLCGGIASSAHSSARRVVSRGIFSHWFVIGLVSPGCYAGKLAGFAVRPVFPCSKSVPFRAPDVNSISSLLCGIEPSKTQAKGYHLLPYCRETLAFASIFLLRDRQCLASLEGLGPYFLLCLTSDFL